MGEENLPSVPEIGIVFLLSVVVIISIWKIFKKAGKPGWAAIIPIYNMYVLLKIVGRPGLWLILYFIPIANIIFHLVVAMDLAKVFNKSKVFGIVLLWLFSFIGYLMLGFGKSTYTPSPSTPAAPPEPAAPPPATPPTSQPA